MLSFYLENIVKYKIGKNILKFKALSLEDHFYLMNSQNEYMMYMFAGIKSENGEIIEDHEKFTRHIFNKYPKVIKEVLALCYLNGENENLTFEEKKVGIDYIPAHNQLEILKLILEISYPDGMYETVKKAEDHLQSVINLMNR